jgi:hypothetical protein
MAGGLELFGPAFRAAMSRQTGAAGSGSFLIAQPAPAGGTILGIVVPLSVKTNILVVSVADTIAHTISDTTNGAYILKDIPPGNYALLFIPADKQYRSNSQRAAVSEGQITVADTVWLMK